MFVTTVFVIIKLKTVLKSSTLKKDLKKICHILAQKTNRKEKPKNLLQ